MNDLDTLLRFYTFGYKAGRRNTFRICVKDDGAKPDVITKAVGLHSQIKRIIARMYGIGVRDVGPDDDAAAAHPAWKAYCWGWGHGRESYESYWSVVVARELRSL